MSKIKTLVASMLLSENKGMSIEEAMTAVAKLSFKEYHRLLEASANITPPSGNIVGPASTQPGQQAQQGQPVQPGQQAQQAQPVPGQPVAGQNIQSAGPQGISQQVPGTQGISQQVPGQPIQPGKQIAGQQAAGQPVQRIAGQPGQQVPGLPPLPGHPATQPPQPTEEEVQLSRLRELAGIKETCSAGATGASAIAVAPTSMGAVRRRQETDETLTKEYVPTEPPKTIIGDTKPSQASGQLSANLAASGLKSASRINNGRKKR